MLIGIDSVFKNEEIFHFGTEDPLFLSQWAKVASIQCVAKYPLKDVWKIAQQFTSNKLFPIWDAQWSEITTDLGI